MKEVFPEKGSSISASSGHSEMMYLTVDGMMSGTGVRETYEGASYLCLSELGLSENLKRDFRAWVERYGNCHRAGYSNPKELESLDRTGIELCARLKQELPEAKVEYFSDALCRKLPT